MEGLSRDQAAVLEHWQTYGQRGKTPDHRVLPHEWEHKPMIKPVTTPWHVKIGPHQLPLLLLGFTPVATRGVPMEIFQVGVKFKSHVWRSVSLRSDHTPTQDQWFIYADGPDHQQQVRVHMHQSWDGRKMLELLLDAGYDGYGGDGEGARIVSITWESDGVARKKNHDAAAYKEVARTVCDWVLNVKLGPEEGEDSRPDATKNVVPEEETIMDTYRLLSPSSDAVSVYMLEHAEGDL